MYERYELTALCAKNVLPRFSGGYSDDDNSAKYTRQIGIFLGLAGKHIWNVPRGDA